MPDDIKVEGDSKITVTYVHLRKLYTDENVAWDTTHMSYLT